MKKKWIIIISVGILAILLLLGIGVFLYARQKNAVSDESLLDENTILFDTDRDVINNQTDFFSDTPYTSLLLDGELSLTCRLDEIKSELDNSRPKASHKDLLEVCTSARNAYYNYDLAGAKELLYDFSQSHSIPLNDELTDEYLVFLDESVYIDVSDVNDDGSLTFEEQYNSYRFIDHPEVYVCAVLDSMYSLKYIEDFYSITPGKDLSFVSASAVTPSSSVIAKEIDKLCEHKESHIYKIYMTNREIDCVCYLYKLDESMHFYTVAYITNDGEERVNMDSNGNIIK